MSLRPLLSTADPRAAMVATLGSDYQAVIAPFKAEIMALAAHWHGDRQRAAMRLLVDRAGRRPTAMEQQLVLAALAELGGNDGVPDDVLARVAARLEQFCAGPPPRSG